MLFRSRERRVRGESERGVRGEGERGGEVSGLQSHLFSVVGLWEGDRALLEEREDCFSWASFRQLSSAPQRDCRYRFTRYTGGLFTSQTQRTAGCTE